MQFEQTAELNRYVDPTIPLTWAVRWRSLKAVLPMLICCSALLVEQVAFRLWLNDRSLLSELPLLVVCSLLPVVLIITAFEVLTRVSHRSRRTVKLEPKRVSISPAKYNRIPWKQITAWQLEPILEAAGLSKLTLSYSLTKGGKRQREWLMVLRKSDQEHELISELEHLRQRGVNSSQVARLSEPAAPKKNTRRVRSMLAVALGVYCILHGLPFLGAGLLPTNRPPDESESNSRFTAKEKAKLRRVVRETFSSPEQFRRFFLGLGGAFTALGAGLYFWGLSTPKGLIYQEADTGASKVGLQPVSSPPTPN
jgi:hypothetical protein